MNDSEKLKFAIKLLGNLINDNKINSDIPQELLNIEGFNELYSSLFEIQHMTKHVEVKFNEISQLESEARESKEHFEEIFNTSPEPTLITRLSDGLIVDVNQAFLHVSGYSREEAVGKNTKDLNIYDSYLSREFMTDQVKKNGAFENIEINFRKKSGEKITALLSSKQTNLKGEPHLIIVARDITERKRLEEALKISEEKYRVLFENATEMIMVVQDGEIKICNPMSETITGYSFNELSSIPAIELVHPEDREGAIYNNKSRLNGRKFETNNIFRMIMKDGSICWVEMRSIKIEWEKKRATLNLITNITKRKEAEEEIKFLSYHDQLTGLYNRRFYEDVMQKYNYSKEACPVTLVMVDLNGLKLTNDAFGHFAGDLLLMSTANILKKECGKSDIIARIGGDEFVILMSKTDDKNAESIIKRIKEAVAKEKMDNIVLSISMGYAVKKDVFHDMNEVFKEAEDNMYKNKLLESSKMKRETMNRIIDTLYCNNIQEKMHSERVSKICEDIAFEVGLNSVEANKIKTAGLLHDIGKTAIDSNTLNKPQSLTASEYAEVKRHSEIGYRILNSVDEYFDVSKFVLEHHEKYDGTGYPKGLKGEEISLGGKIIAIAEAFDAMTSERPYKKMLSEEEAIKEIRKNEGKQFDPVISELFIKNVLKRYRKKI